MSAKYFFEGKEISLVELKNILDENEDYCMEVPETELGEITYDDFTDFVCDLKCYTREGWTIHIKKNEYGLKAIRFNNIITLCENFKNSFTEEDFEDLIRAINEMNY